jgi:hypothetical protein
MKLGLCERLRVTNEKGIALICNSVGAGQSRPYEFEFADGDLKNKAAAAQK